jgi:hypothetical protein
MNRFFEPGFASHIPIVSQSLPTSVPTVSPEIAAAPTKNRLAGKEEFVMDFS